MESSSTSDARLRGRSAKTGLMHCSKTTGPRRDDLFDHLVGEDEHI